MKLCISQATTMTTSFADDVAGYAAGGVNALEVWLTKLEEHLKTTSAADTRKLLEDKQMTLAGASYQGGLLLSDGAARAAHYDHFKRRLDLCQFFGIPTLLLVADFVEKVDPSVLQHALAALATAGEWAEAFGIKLAVEFRGRSTFCASLDTAASLVAACGKPNVGLCLDVFHYYTGPSKYEDLGLLGPENLFFVQMCDLAGVPRELATDADRIFPGEGDFLLGPILHVLKKKGYTGWLSLELFNPTLWQAKVHSVAELGLAALQRLLTL
jgi:sugar phosphate isomerase/epimerase